jgi:hypothetical protein
MAGDCVFIVHLRRPRSKSDPRSDPFWEFGSFGLTGCHARNLMNPKNTDRLSGARLAFAQGGPEGTRLVHLTPPVRVVVHQNKAEETSTVEATWTPAEMPLCYGKAPKLAYNCGPSDFPKLETMLMHGNRSTIEAQFSSAFRSRTTPLNNLIGRDLIRVYSQMRRASRAGISKTYTDALPLTPTTVDEDRHVAYNKRLESARGEIERAKCRSNSRGPC